MPLPGLWLAKTLLTGGTSAAVDGIDGNSLADGHIIIPHLTGDTMYPYVEDHDAGLAQNSPWVLVPTSNPGSIGLILQTIYPIVRTSYDLYFKQEYLDKDIKFSVNDGGVTTYPLWIDGSLSEVVLEGNLRFDSNKGIKPYSTTLNDDAILTICTAVDGTALVVFDTGANAKHALIFIAADGSFSCPLYHPSIKFTGTDDGFWNIYTDSTSIKTINKTGSNNLEIKVIPFVS